ncbi:MAG: LysR substrate-binding domain-containing protein, partial [Gammaproteobacteria bacterium]|nr:LysR substrate-binding domain-containing protein [Gammaproteobacteria bacterium]
LGKLAVHQLDMIISDRGISAGLNVKAYTHELGQSGTSIFASPNMAKHYKKDFPDSLNQAPFLVPTTSNPMRRALEGWLEGLNLTPQIIAEFDDSALMKAFGQEGHGLFPSPTAIAGEIQTMYGAKVIGMVPEVIENYYAISPERRLKHPVVLNIIETIRDSLFS